MNTVGRVVITVELGLLSLGLVVVALWLLMAAPVEPVRPGAAVPVEPGVITARHVEPAPRRKTGDRMRRRLRVLWHADAGRVGQHWFGTEVAGPRRVPIVSEVVRDELPPAFAPGATVHVAQLDGLPGGLRDIALDPAALSPSRPHDPSDAAMAFVLFLFGLGGLGYAGIRARRHLRARRATRRIPWESRWFSSV
jgi:hypothetical protein